MATIPCPTCGLDPASGASDGKTHDWCRSIEQASRMMMMSPCFRCRGQFGAGFRLSVLVDGRPKAICQTCLTAVMIFHEPLMPVDPKRP